MTALQKDLHGNIKESNIWKDRNGSLNAPEYPNPIRYLANVLQMASFWATIVASYPPTANYKMRH